MIRRSISGAMDTIFALSSGSLASLPAAIAIIRISGDATPAILRGYVAAQQASVRALHCPVSGEVLDYQAMTLWLPKPSSATGEHMAELHVHGGRAVVDGVLSAIPRAQRDDSQQHAIRHADPGEFTWRAFRNGLLDLTQAEYTYVRGALSMYRRGSQLLVVCMSLSTGQALSDILHAETQQQRRQAIAQSQGLLKDLYSQWREKLIRCCAYVEASLDFGEDDELETESMDQRAREWVVEILAAINSHLDDRNRGEITRNGVKIALVGAPNAGKSSLLNCLARREVAIVSSIPGTTRDIVQLQLDVGGHKAIVTDTAGVRESADEIERQGIKRALTAASEADVVIHVIDSMAQPASSAEALFHDTALDQAPCKPIQPSLTVLNKVDLVDGPNAPSGAYSAFSQACEGRAVSISCKTGQGMDQLIKAIEEQIEQRLGHGQQPAMPASDAVISRARHRDLLRECTSHLESALHPRTAALELVAEDLRRACVALGQLTGQIDIEDVLDRLFSEFCIGK